MKRCGAPTISLLALLVSSCGGDGQLAGRWAVAAQSEAEATAEQLTPWPAEIPGLRFGVTPFMDPEAMRREFSHLLGHLSQRFGVPVTLVVAENYADLGGRMQHQEVDLGKFSPLSYVEAEEHDPGLRLLLRQVAEGSTTYLGYILTLAGHPARSLADLAGTSFCYVDPHSTSGYLYPRALLRAQDLDPDTLFGRVVYGGSHSECLRQLLDGEVEAAAVYSGGIFAARRKGAPLHRLKVLGKTARIPYDAYCVRSGLPAAAAQRIREEFLTLSTRSSGGRLVLGEAKRRLNAFTLAQRSDYDSVREALASSRASVARGGP